MFALPAIPRNTGGIAKGRTRIRKEEKLQGQPLER